MADSNAPVVKDDRPGSAARGAELVVPADWVELVGQAVSAAQVVLVGPVALVAVVALCDPTLPEHVQVARARCNRAPRDPATPGLGLDSAAVPPLLSWMTSWADPGGTCRGQVVPVEPPRCQGSTIDPA